MNEIVWTALLPLSLSFHMSLRHLTAVNPHSSLPAHWCNASPSLSATLSRSLSFSLSVRWLFTWESRRLNRQNVIRYTFLFPAVCGSCSHSLNTKPPPPPVSKNSIPLIRARVHLCSAHILPSLSSQGLRPRKVMFGIGLDLDWVQFQFAIFFGSTFSTILTFYESQNHLLPLITFFTWLQTHKMFTPCCRRTRSEYKLESRPGFNELWQPNGEMWHPVVLWLSSIFRWQVKFVWWQIWKWKLDWSEEYGSLSTLCCGCSIIVIWVCIKCIIIVVVQKFQELYCYGGGRGSFYFILHYDSMLFLS